MIIYENVVRELGSKVSSFFDDNIIILFCNNVPETLREFCYIVDLVNLDEDIIKGQLFKVDDFKFKIKHVGSLVKKNLNDLGHITLARYKPNCEYLPGTLYLEDFKIPDIKIGSKISIFIDD